MINKTLIDYLAKHNYSIGKTEIYFADGLESAP